MSFAAFAVPGILAPLQAFVHWLVTEAVPLVRPPAQKAVAGYPLAAGTSVPVLERQAAVRTRTDVQRAPSARCANRPHAKPLGVQARKPAPAVRMVRLVEDGQAPASAGRMVISGRMADVCAELDRLVLREATLH